MEIYFECGKVAVLKESQDNLNHYTADLIIPTPPAVRGGCRPLLYLTSPGNLSLEISSTNVKQPPIQLY